MTTPFGRSMPGYEAATYGDRFVDVYDEWYGDLTDTDACVAAVAALAHEVTAGGDPPRLLELGVGTGRLAIPLAASDLAVTGVDASAAMLAALAAKPGGHTVTGVVGDMTDPPVGSQRFDVVLVAYNTLFNLVEPGQQAACLQRVATLLEPGGALVVEAFVPDPEPGSGSAVTTRQVTADRVVLSVSRTDASGRLAIGQYVDISEQGIRLRPWQVRWADPAELDAMAATAGLAIAHRWADWHCAPFGPDAAAHVSVYRLAP